MTQAPEFGLRVMNPPNESPPLGGLLMSTTPYHNGLTPTELRAHLCDDGELTEACTIRGLRIGVMLIESAMVFAVGTRLSIRFRLPWSPAALELPVLVRWCGDDHIGVQVDSIGIHDTIALTEFIRERRMKRSAA